MPSESHSSATEAFNALRAEVTAVHTQLLVVAARAVPDYDLTLGEFARRLGQVENSLKHLSLCLPPAMLRGESEMTLSMREAADAMHARTAELIAATGSATTKQVVRRQVAGAGVLGIVAGLLLCAVLVVLLPRQAGAWMTADLLGGDPWTAGLTLARMADPVRSSRMLRLYEACPQDSRVELCVAGMTLQVAKDAPQ